MFKSRERIVYLDILGCLDLDGGSFAWVLDTKGASFVWFIYWVFRSRERIVCLGTLDTWRELVSKEISGV